jgi:hypothetical protein
MRNPTVSERMAASAEAAKSVEEATRAVQKAMGEIETVLSRTFGSMYGARYWDDSQYEMLLDAIKVMSNMYDAFCRARGCVAFSEAHAFDDVEYDASFDPLDGLEDEDDEEDE